ncbi:tyrosine-protein phosphatase non-receptor type 23 isoform X2 [Stigmatopora argus]
MRGRPHDTVVQGGRKESSASSKPLQPTSSDFQAGPRAPRAAAMEAVPRMPMIWLDLKEAGDFHFTPAVRQFILKNYGENPDNYNEQLKKLETLRQGAVNVTRDFEGCSTLRKYFGQLHYLQSRVPMATGQEAAVSISWTEIFSGKTVVHDDISYEQACILYNLGALHSMLGAMDNRVSEEGMKVSCTHFQCSAGAFYYLRDHFSHNFSVDMSHQILNLNINLMLGQAQECLLEKSMLDNRKSYLVARISAQVVDYYKEACRALENSETASMLGKIQKDWKKLVQMKIYYFAAIAHLHMGKQAEEQQKYGERVSRRRPWQYFAVDLCLSICVCVQLAYLQSSMDKLSEAIKLAKGQPDSVQDALRFTMDVIGGKFNSAKKDNDFIYHESVPSLETLASVKGAPLVKALPVNPTDPSVTGPDLFAKLVPMAAHEASSLYSEEKAKLLRDVMAKIDSRNDTLEQFMDSLGLEPESVDNLDMYSHIPPVLMEKCAALSVRPDTVKSLVQSMQVLSGVFTDVESSLREIQEILEADEAGEKALRDAGAPADAHPAPQAALLSEMRRDLEKYAEAHEKASFTNTELHRAMNLHISNLRLLGGPLENLREALPRPQLSEEEVAGLQCVKRILGKVQEMREQRSSLERQLRDLIQHDDITSTLVTTERADIKNVFEEQLKKYEQVKVYVEQNLAAQENILKALTEANVQYALVRKSLRQTEQQWSATVQGLVGSYEAYEDLMKKSQEGKEFYDDLEEKAARLLERAKTLCQTRTEARKPVLERESPKKPPARPTAAKPSFKPNSQDDDSSLEDPELAQINAAILALAEDGPEELSSRPPDIPSLQRPGPEAFLPPGGGGGSVPWPASSAANLPRFPANLPPPELLARIARFPTPGVLHAPIPHLPNPQMTLQMPRQVAYGPPVPQRVPTASYEPTPRHPVAPGISAAYAGPPPMGAYPRFLPQMTQPNQYPPPVGQAPPPDYRVGPTVLPPPRHPSLQGYPHGYVAQQPGAPPHYPHLFPGHLQAPANGYQAPPPMAQGYQAPQNYAPQHQAPVMPMAAQGLMAPPSAPLQHHPPAPQTVGPVSQAYPSHRHPQSAQIAAPVSQHYPPHQHPQMPHCSQQFAPHSQIPTGPGGPVAPCGQAIHPQMGPPMPPASQPHLIGPQAHLPRHAPPTSLSPQHQHQHPGPPPVPIMPQPPVSGPGHTQVQGHHSGGICYPGSPPAMPRQPLAPQSAASHGTVHSQVPMYLGAPGPHVPPSAPLRPPPVGVPPHGVQACPGGPPVGQAGQPPSISPAPSTSPTPGPSTLVPRPSVTSDLGSASGAVGSPPSASTFQLQHPGNHDLLSSSPDNQSGSAEPPANVLQPTKADPRDGERRKEDSRGVLLIQGDPYRSPELLARLQSELEGFRARVDSLEELPEDERGASALDGQWRELQEQQEKDARQLSIAIARCYAMKNRHQDVMPYDLNRVLLRSGKDDYINASYVEELSAYCPQIIATQAPLTGTAADFWLMVYEQKVSLVVALVSEQEVEKGKVARYFPTERGQQLSQGPITLSLSTQKTTPTHVERMISLRYRDQSLKRTVVHLQFTSWPELGLPESQSNLLRFIQEVHGHYLHQRPAHTPVVVHCSSGVGRTGAFCLLYAAVQELEAGNGVADLRDLVRKMRRQRKNMLQEKVGQTPNLQVHLLTEAGWTASNHLTAAPQVLLRGAVAARRTGAPPARRPSVERRQERGRFLLQAPAPGVPARPGPGGRHPHQLHPGHHRQAQRAAPQRRGGGARRSGRARVAVFASRPGAPSRSGAPGFAPERAVPSAAQRRGRGGIGRSIGRPPGASATPAAAFVFGAAGLPGARGLLHGGRRWWAGQTTGDQAELPAAGRGAGPPREPGVRERGPPQRPGSPVESQQVLKSQTLFVHILKCLTNDKIK